MGDEVEQISGNKRRILQLDQCFPGKKDSFWEAGRVLVGEGILTKLCRKKSKARQFFLFSDVIVYATIAPTVMGKKRFLNPHTLLLKEVTVTPVDDSDHFKNSWMMSNVTKSFIVSAATEGEKDEWVAHINKCIDDLEAQGVKTLRNSQSHAAVWTTDRIAPTCMVCNKTKFTAIKRRHHCRNCGKVVCGSCSKDRFVLPNIAPKPVRVCGPCYSTLVDKEVGKWKAPPEGSAAASAAGDGAPAAPAAVAVAVVVAPVPAPAPDAMETAEDGGETTDDDVLDREGSSGEEEDEPAAAGVVSGLSAENSALASFQAGNRSSVFFSKDMAALA